MKEKFDSFKKQGHYITRLIKYQTDLQKLCQFCGNPAKVKNNRIDPYKIQFVCDNCRNKHKLDDLTDMFIDIPLIDVKQHIKSKILQDKMIDLTPEIIDKLKYILDSNFTKNQAIEYLGVSINTYNRLINLYNEIDKDYIYKIKNRYRYNRSKLMSKWLIKDNLEKDNINNLFKIKYEKNLTNRDIAKLSDNKLLPGSISNYCKGKIIPEIKTKCLLAEILNVSVFDIFPSDTEFKDVYNYNDYINLNNKYRNILKNKKIKRVKLSLSLNMSRLRICNFINDKANLNNEELKIIKNYLEGLNE